MITLGPSVRCHKIWNQNWLYSIRGYSCIRGNEFKFHKIWNSGCRWFDNNNKWWFLSEWFLGPDFREFYGPTRFTLHCWLLSAIQNNPQQMLEITNVLNYLGYSDKILINLTIGCQRSIPLSGHWRSKFPTFITIKLGSEDNSKSFWRLHYKVPGKKWKSSLLGCNVLPGRTCACWTTVRQESFHFRPVFKGGDVLVKLSFLTTAERADVDIYVEAI